MSRSGRGERAHRADEERHVSCRGVRRHGPDHRKDGLPEGDHPTEAKAAKARIRLLTQVEAGNHPDRAATLMGAWSEAVDHSLNTRATNEVFVRRVILPALGDMPLRKLQYRVDMLDRLYTHLRRCSSLCDGKPFTERKVTAVHDCGVMKCNAAPVQPLAPSSAQRRDLGGKTSGSAVF